MIRWAKLEDVDQINELRKEVNDLHIQGRPETFKPGFGPELKNHVLNYLNSEAHGIAVEDRNGIITGMVMIDYIVRPENAYNLEQQFVHIAEVCVRRECRRQGIAHRLFDFVKEDARTKGFHQIQLDVWSFNDALTFYEKEGFTVFRRFLELKLDKPDKEP